MSISISISFESLLQTIRSLNESEKQLLWDILSNELQIDNLDDLEEEAEVSQAYQEYQLGNYVTLDQYHSDRLSRMGESFL
ncbi:MAG: hypothetical protein ACO3NK_19785 [Prochlorotrichaceae cyanobacterium]|jgi:hypothetical protein